MPDALPGTHPVSARAWRLAFLALSCLALAAGTPSRAQADARDDDSTTDQAPADTRRAASVLPMLEERARLVSDLLADASRAYRKLAIERGAVQQEFADALEKLDREAARARESSQDRLDGLDQDAQRARARLDQLLTLMARRVDDMRRLMAERDLIARRVADLKGRGAVVQEPLSGTWEVTWMPGGTSGTFFLDQSGTLVTGQYKLGSLGAGSLQGTFVGGKLYLQRIDAQRGRDAEIEGVLEADGRIRGTWQNFEMVQGGIPRGQWVARRVR